MSLPQRRRAIAAPPNRGLAAPTNSGVAAQRNSGLAAWLRDGLACLPLDWLVARPCPLCRRLPPAGSPGRGLCWTCSTRLALPERGLSGQWPLPWWSSAPYAGALRQTLLHLRGRPDRSAIRALLGPLIAHLRELGLNGSAGRPPLLVPIPSWKRRANPLPALIADGLARGLALRRRDLLARSRAVLGQHHLGRELRQRNQAGAFRLGPAATGRGPAPVLIVDDILTTGSTVRHAALCLEEAGWPVLGAVCLARTPARRDWLRGP